MYIGRSTDISQYSKVIVPEFREYSIKDIIPCIGETIVSLTVPEKLCIKIESDGTEDVDIEDGKLFTT